MKTFTGRCQCGAVRYETKRPSAAWVCHCFDCQRMSSSAYSFSMAVPADGFHWTRGTPRVVEKTSDHGTKSEQLFCGDCGTWLAGKSPAAPTTVLVRVGTLDDHGWIAPAAQIWSVHALSWALLPGVREVAGDPTPEQMAEVSAAWTAAHPA